MHIDSANMLSFTRAGQRLHSVDIPLRFAQWNVIPRSPVGRPSRPPAPRLVGIFVFRVNKDLYYAPVFFINGAIKGTDLFYRHTTKSFVPLNERWVEYLISLSETSEGKGVPISERINTRRQLNL